MSFAKFYILVSALIGLLQIVDGIFYVLHSGEPQLFNHLFSLLETGWVLVSIAAIIVFLNIKLPLTLPISYAAYNFSGWTYGVILCIQLIMERKEGPVPVPIWAYWMGVVFGAYFCLYSFFNWRKLNGGTLKKP